MIRQRKVEDYLKTIYLLQRSGPVRGKDIACQLNVKRPTVSACLKELEKEGYLFRPQDRSIKLTAKGLAIATDIADRHQNIYKLLIALGVDESTAERDACSIEHAISLKSLYTLFDLLRMQPGIKGSCTVSSEGADRSDYSKEKGHDL